MKLKTAHKRMFSMFMDHENYNWLKQEAERTGLTSSEIIRRSIRMTRELAETFVTKAA